MTPEQPPAPYIAKDAPWCSMNLPVAKDPPGILSGSSVTVVPFGGSINNNDLLEGISSKDNGIGKYLVGSVHIGLLGLNQRAIGLNTMSPVLTQKDSSLLTLKDYRKLKERIEELTADLILVPMGLMKATEVGRWLDTNLSEEVKSSKLIVITGSHDLFTAYPGDARFNLGYAYAQRMSSERGVRVAINSGLYNPDEVCIDFTERSVFFNSEAMENSISPIATDTLIIGMGGTIEGQELDISQQLSRGFSQSYLAQVINPRQMPHFYDLAVTKDSRELSDSDVLRLKAILRAAKQTELVITVGTWGAEHVGVRLLQDSELMAALHRDGKRVVFAVACTLPTEQHSDAFYNLGFARGSVSYLKSGVYLSVHGLISELGAMTKVSVPSQMGPYFAPTNPR